MPHQNDGVQSHPWQLTIFLMHLAYLPRVPPEFDDERRGGRGGGGGGGGGGWGWGETEAIRGGERKEGGGGGGGQPASLGKEMGLTSWLGRDGMFDNCHHIDGPSYPGQTSPAR